MTDEVTEFYDGFLEKTMVKYRLHPNLRIEAAIELVTPFVKPDSIIADVGCGIGIVSEAIARKEPSARVIGLDLSPENILYAQKTIDEPNATFIASSITRQFSDLRNAAGAPLDLICMIDVLEHIPEDDRATVLKDLADLAADDATFVLAYPSPEYQRHRTEHDPDILQIIDNVIEFDDLYKEIREAGWHLYEMRYRGVWVPDEYVYLVLKKQTPSDFEKFYKFEIRKLPSRLLHIATLPYKRWKYAKAPFRD